MRYLVSFAHRKYLDELDRLQADPGYRIPEGLHRQITVVVEADTAAEAILRAETEMGWPDAEMDLVPIGVTSQQELARQVEEQRPTMACPT